MKLFETIHKNNYTLGIDKALGYDKAKENTVKRFISFCIKYLSLVDNVDIQLVDERKKHKIKTTAYYNHEDKKVVVYAKNRMLVDVLRSLAHELVHAQQWEDNRITLPVPDVGGIIENEANAVAGIIIKKFIYQETDGSNLFEGKKYL